MGLINREGGLTRGRACVRGALCELEKDLQKGEMKEFCQRFFGDGGSISP